MRSFSSKRASEKSLKELATALESSISIQLRAKDDLPVAIYRTAPSGLDRSALIAVAILAGTETMKGLKGCGTVIAMALAQSGVGRLLADAFERGRATGDMQAELAIWRDEVANLLEAGLSTSTGSAQVTKHATLACQLRKSASFPDPDILGHHFRPAVDHLPSTQSLTFDLTVSFLDFVGVANPCFHWPGWECETHAVRQIYPVLVINHLRSIIESKSSASSAIKVLSRSPARVTPLRPTCSKATFDMASVQPSLTAAILLPIDDQHYRSRNNSSTLKKVDIRWCELSLPVSILDKVFPSPFASWVKAGVSYHHELKNICADF